MQSMQRQFGKLMKRSADDSQVAVLMNDFNESDKLLGRVFLSLSLSFNLALNQALGRLD